MVVGGGRGEGGGTNLAFLRSLAITLKLCNLLNITNFTKMLFSLVPTDFPLLVPV